MGEPPPRDLYVVTKRSVSWTGKTKWQGHVVATVRAWVLPYYGTDGEGYHCNYQLMIGPRGGYDVTALDGYGVVSVGGSGPADSVVVQERDWQSLVKTLQEPLEEPGRPASRGNEICKLLLGRLLEEGRLT